MRKFAFAAVAWMAASFTALAQQSYPYCQILDGSEAPAWRAQLGYTAEADVEAPEGSGVAMWSASGGGGLYYWRTDLGDIDLAGLYDLWLLDGSGGVDLPDQLAALRLQASMLSRNWNGGALQVSVYPGIYSDLQDLSLEDLFLPFQVLGIQAFNPQISGVMGVMIYPGFDRTFDPRFGIRAAPADSVRVDLMYPESRVTFRPDNTWEVFGGLRHSAVNEFRLEEDDPRDQFSFRETQFYAGFALPLEAGVRLSAELGYALNREIDFDRVEPARDLDEAWFIRVGIGSEL